MRRNPLVPQRNMMNTSLKRCCIDFV
jgi:hypothetical protein